MTINLLNIVGIRIAGQALEVVLAKPQTEKKSDGFYSYNTVPHANHLPHPGYGAFPGNPYGTIGSGYGVAAAGFQQVPQKFYYGLSTS